MNEDDSEREPHERRPYYHSKFREDLTYWTNTAPGVAKRALRMVEETLLTPFTGIGKPEPLRFDQRGRWSRRLTRHDRMIYRVTEETVEFFSARNHYPRR